MTGLEKVQEQILDEASNLAEEKVKSAKKDAENMCLAAMEEASKIQQEIAARSQEEVKRYNEKIASQGDMQKRTRLLETKQELIGELFDKALVHIKEWSTQEYFTFLEQVIESKLKPKDGILYFSKKDRSRMSLSTELKIKSLAREKGGSLSVSRETREISDGFILAYGTIEENCTIEALFNDKKEDIRDELQKLLFS